MYRGTSKRKEIQQQTSKDKFEAMQRQGIIIISSVELDTEDPPPPGVLPDPCVFDPQIDDPSAQEFFINYVMQLKSTQANILQAS